MGHAEGFTGSDHGASPGEHWAGGDAVPRDPMEVGNLVSGAAFIDGPGAVPSPGVARLTPAELAVLRGESRRSAADAIIRTTLDNET